MSNHHPRRFVRALAAATCLALVVTACGDDDDTEAAAGGSVEEYCAAIIELDSQDGPPSDEQMEHIKDVRPDEIGEDVDFVADAFIAADGDMGAVFADPEVEERLGEIEAWEADNCPDEGGDDEGGDDDGEQAIAPEVQEYCTFVEELDSQDGPPTTEQMERIKEIRPDEIGEDIDFVADAFIAADGDIGAVFSDPAVEEAFGRIEAFDAENCGFETEEDEEEEQATEPTEGAEVVEITGVDFAFEGVPETVPAGPVSLGFTNAAESGHEMMIFKLGEGADMNELLAREEPPSEEEAQDVGDVFAGAGEGPFYVNADLEPATYAVVCFIPGPEGKAHHELGMKATFTVE